MAFDNKSIRPILENEELSIKDKVNQLQTLHHEIVNGLMDEKDEAIQRAEKAEKAAESAKAEKEAAEKSLTDYKAGRIVFLSCYLDSLLCLSIRNSQCSIKFFWHTVSI